MADLNKLKTELDTDPLERGYASMADVAAAVDLNTEYRTRDVLSVSGQQLFEAVDPTDFAGLSDAQKALLYAIVGMGTILVNGTNTKAALLAMFGAGTTTRSNLATLQTETFSRATEIGLGGVKVGYVQQARAQT